MLKLLQREQADWSNINFPENTSEDALLGVMEELGELSHAHLKSKQGIRTNENHSANKIDAIGDIVIFLASYCTKEGIDFESAVRDTWTEVKQRNWTKNKETGIEDISQQRIKQILESASLGITDKIVKVVEDTYKDFEETKTKPPL